MQTKNTPLPRHDPGQVPQGCECHEHKSERLRKIGENEKEELMQNVKRNAEDLAAISEQNLIAELVVIFLLDVFASR